LDFEGGLQKRIISFHFLQLSRVNFDPLLEDNFSNRIPKKVYRQDSKNVLIFFPLIAD